MRQFAIMISAALAIHLAPPASADDYGGKNGVLPLGTQIDNDVLLQPREVFSSDAHGGSKPYIVKLGDLAFNSPSILGGVARQAGISCGTCHINATTNARFFIPGMSSRPGNFDPTGPVFNPDANDHVVDPVTIPSLRGVRSLAPYGHNGRYASLGDFVHAVIVNEFAGPEPSPLLQEAIVAYLQDVDFLPNPRLGPLGHLVGHTTDSEKRGEALFSKPFPGDSTMSCAACHRPSAAFVDHQQHDVGTGGLFKTPTLLDANFNAPYFHDGRYDSYDQVVAYFDHTFALGLSAEDRQDLTAYLTAVGGGERPYERDGVALRMREIDEFDSVLDQAVARNDSTIVALSVDTIGRELREFAEQFPARKDVTASGGEEQRGAARAALKDLVLQLRAVGLAVGEQGGDAAQAKLAAYHDGLAKDVAILTAAEPYSLFDPAIHDAHFAAMRQLFSSAIDPRDAGRIPADRD
ncbi:MAG TPA: cytochrome c peroxidase [Stellaceae bacterium]|jgi:hypothetical protein